MYSRRFRGSTKEQSPGGPLVRPIHDLRRTGDEQPGPHSILASRGTPCPQPNWNNWQPVLSDTSSSMGCVSTHRTTRRRILMCGSIRSRAAGCSIAFMQRSGAKFPPDRNVLILFSMVHDSLSSPRNIWLASDRTCRHHPSRSMSGSERCSGAIWSFFCDWNIRARIVGRLDMKWRSAAIPMERNHWPAASPSPSHSRMDRRSSSVDVSIASINYSTAATRVVDYKTGVLRLTWRTNGHLCGRPATPACLICPCRPRVTQKTKHDRSRPRRLLLFPDSPWQRRAHFSAIVRLPAHTERRQRSVRGDGNWGVCEYAGPADLRLLCISARLRTEPMGTHGAETPKPSQHHAASPYRPHASCLSRPSCPTKPPVLPSRWTLTGTCWSRPALARGKPKASLVAWSPGSSRERIASNTWLR